MTTRRIRLAAAMLIAIVLAPRVAAADGLPESAIVLDDKIVTYLRPIPLVSPDGRHVAYVSRGYICVADIEAHKVRRLAEVPGSWTHVYASADEGSEGGSPESLSRAVEADMYNELQAKVNCEINDFQWTADSAAIVYRVARYAHEQQATPSGIYLAPLAGEPKEIASSHSSPTASRGPGGVITRDGRFLVGNYGRDRALIWDIATNEPRPTPYLYLTPSPTSRRWLGVEKDTRQLVVLDEDFEIVKRDPEILPKNQYGFDMIWSPDERFVFWRQQIGFDYYSNWVGCRYDLKTRQRDIFTGDYMEEKITFTAHRGEFLRVGSAGVQRNYSGLDTVEHYVGLVRDGRLHMQRLWSLRADPSGMTSKVRMLARMPNVTWSPDWQLFTIGLPRQEGPYGEVFHLADRHRHLWKLPGEGAEQYTSPYDVAGFALGGTVIVAYDDTRLFALPISAIRTFENKVR